MTAMLLEVLGSPDASVRYEVLLALNRRGYRGGGDGRLRIERALEDEIAEMGRLLAAQVDLGDGGNGAAAMALLDAALGEAIGRSRELMLLCLACLYDAQAIKRVRDTLLHPSAEKQAYAIEALDNLIAQEHKQLIALLSNELAPTQRLRPLDGLARAPLGRAGRLREIVASPDEQYTPWLRACVQYALAHDTSVDATAVARLDGAQDGAAMLSLVEKVLILKTVGSFASIPDSTLAEVAALLEEQDLSVGETLFEKGDTGRCMYIIVAGRVRVHDGGRLLNELGERDIVGEIAVLDAFPRSASVTAIEDTRLLRLDQDPLYELMADHVEVARGIIQVLLGHLRARVQDVAGLRARVQELEGQRQI